MQNTKHIRSDNGTQFVAADVACRLARVGTGTLFVAPGSPWESGYTESFNSRLRDELFDRELFIGLAEAPRPGLDHFQSPLSPLPLDLPEEGWISSEG